MDTASLSGLFMQALQRRNYTQILYTNIYLKMITSNNKTK